MVGVAYKEGNMRDPRCSRALFGRASAFAIVSFNSLFISSHQPLLLNYTREATFHVPRDIRVTL